MRFEFNGVEYALEFSRAHRKITRWNGSVVTSKHPYTRLTIYRSEGGKLPGEMFRTVSVGVGKGDTYTKEAGRLAAMRAITRSFGVREKELKTALWLAYLNRGISG